MRKPVVTNTKHSTRPSQLSEYSPESKLRRMKRFLSSPLTRRKNVCHKAFGISLSELAQRNPNTKVPPIVKRLSKYLEENGLKQEGIFRVSGNVKTIEKICQKFNETGDANLEEENDVCSAACVLKLFLRELPEPIMPHLLSPHFIAVHEENKKNIKDNLKHLTRLVLLLPEENYHLLKYLIRFLAKVCEQREHNKMTSLALGVVFGPNIFRVSSGLDGLKEQAITNDIVTLFIENHFSVFRMDSVKTPSSPQKPLTFQSSFREIGGFKAETACFKSMDESSLWAVTKARNNPDFQPDVLSHPSMSSRSLKRMVNQSIDEVVSQNLFVSGHSLDKGSPSKRVLRQLSFEDTENLYADASQKSNRLKRSKSHSEVTSLNQEDSCTSVAHDDTVLTLQGSHSGHPRHDEVPRSFNLDFKHQGDSTISRGLAPQETLSYDSDETHELKRRSERENQIGKRIRRKSWSSKKAQVVDPASKKLSSLINSESGEENEEVLPSSILLDLSNLHVHGHGSEPIPSKQHACSSWKLSSTVSNGSSPDNVVPCPRTSHLKNTSSLEDSETPQQYLNERRDFFSGLTKGIEGESVFMQQLKKKIQWLKRKVKSFETEFEEKRGYKPSHAEKMNNHEVKGHWDKLLQAKKELKELQQETIAPPVIPPPSPDSLEKYNVSKNIEENITPPLSPPSSHSDIVGATQKPHPTVSETLSHIKRVLDEQRINNRRPESVESMTPQQVINEKIALQKSLLHFERIHGRPENNNERDSMRPLYDRYRHVKKMIARCSSPNTPRSESNANTELAPIIEDKTMNFVSPSREVGVESVRQTPKSKPSKSENLRDEKHPLHSSRLEDTKKISCNLHELSYFDLIKQFELTKAYKQQVRARISNFEDHFLQENARKVQKEDRGAMSPVYQQYKEIKAKLKLMDALITKYENVG